MTARRVLPERDLLTTRDMAFRLNVSARTVWRWVAQGRLPEPIRYSSRMVRWRARDLEAYVLALRPTPVAG